jgi:hypothetical protein
VLPAVRNRQARVSTTNLLSARFEREAGAAPSSPAHRDALDDTPNFMGEPCGSVDDASDSIDDTADEGRDDEVEAVKSRAHHPELPGNDTHQERVDRSEDYEHQES